MSCGCPRPGSRTSAAAGDPQQADELDLLVVVECPAQELELPVGPAADVEHPVRPAPWSTTTSRPLLASVCSPEAAMSISFSGDLGRSRERADSVEAEPLAVGTELEPEAERAAVASRLRLLTGNFAAGLVDDDRRRSCDRRSRRRRPRPEARPGPIRSWSG